MRNTSDNAFSVQPKLARGGAVNTIRTKAAAVLLAALALMATVGCSAGAPEEEELGLTVRPLNYTDVNLDEIFVDGIWVGGEARHGGGYSVAGSIGVPAKWRPGITVKVEWSDDPLYMKDPKASYSASVVIPPYQEKLPSSLWLQFYPGGRLAAVASSYVPGHPLFPGGLKSPVVACLDDPACLAKFGDEAGRYSCITHPACAAKFGKKWGL